MSRYVIFHDDGSQREDANVGFKNSKIKNIIRSIQDKMRVNKTHRWFYASTSKYSILGIPKTEEGRLVFDFITVDYWLSYPGLYIAYKKYMKMNGVEPADPPLTIKRTFSERGIQHSRRVIQGLLTLYWEGGNLSFSLPIDAFRHYPVQMMLMLLNIDISNTDEFKTRIKVIDDERTVLDLNRFSNIARSFLLDDGKINSTLIELMKQKRDGKWITGAKVDETIQAMADISFLTDDPELIWKALIDTTIAKYRPYSTLKWNASRSSDPVCYIEDLLDIKDHQGLIIELNRLFPTFPYLQMLKLILDMSFNRSESDQEVI